MVWIKGLRRVGVMGVGVKGIGSRKRVRPLVKLERF
jgi:hypothetical protein